MTRWLAAFLGMLGGILLLGAAWVGMTIRDQLTHAQGDLDRWERVERRRHPLDRAHLGTQPPFGGDHACSEGWEFQLETANPEGVARRVRMDAFVLRAHPPSPDGEGLVFCVPAERMDQFRTCLEATQARVHAQPVPDPPSDGDPRPGPPHSQAYQAARVEIVPIGGATPLLDRGFPRLSAAWNHPIRFWLPVWGSLTLGLLSLAGGGWLWRRARPNGGIPERE